jgi:hypothetical protein
MRSTDITRRARGTAARAGHSRKVFPRGAAEPRRTAARVGCYRNVISRGAAEPRRTAARVGCYRNVSPRRGAGDVRRRGELQRQRQRQQQQQLQQPALRPSLASARISAPQRQRAFGAVDGEESCAGARISTRKAQPCHALLARSAGPRASASSPRLRVELPARGAGPSGSSPRLRGSAWKCLARRAAPSGGPPWLRGSAWKCLARGAAPSGGPPWLRVKSRCGRSRSESRPPRSPERTRCVAPGAGEALEPRHDPIPSGSRGNRCARPVSGYCVSTRDRPFRLPQPPSSP